MNYEKNFSNDIATSSQPEHRNTSPKQNDRPENYHYNAPAQHQPSAPNFVSPLSSSVPPLNTSTQQSFVQFSNTQQPPPYNTQQPVNQQAPPYNTQQPVNQQTQPYFGQPIHYQQSPAYYGQPFNQHSNLVVLPPATVTLGSYSCFNFTMAIVLSCITIWFYGVIFGVIAFTLASKSNSSMFQYSHTKTYVYKMNICVIYLKS